MRFSAAAHPRTVALSLLLVGVGPREDVLWQRLAGIAPACDTVAVPVSGLVTLVAPVPTA